MQLTIVHDTIYRYGQAAHMIIQALRMWPAPSAGQTIINWRVDVDGKRLQPTCDDGFGNPVATHTIDRSIETLRLSVRGLVNTRDLNGVFGDHKELLPPMFYLASTPLTESNEAIDALAVSAAGAGNQLERLHRLTNGIRDRIDYLPYQTDAETTAVQAFAAEAGVCQDHAHVLIAAARSLGFPARYVSGYLCPIEGAAAASHAWAEIFVDDLGWLGFDAANRQSPDERYVRIACGRDYRDAAPVRGVRLGGIAESLEVEVSVAESGQSQSQSSY